MMEQFMWETGPVEMLLADGTYQTSQMDHCVPLWSALMGYVDSVMCAGKRGIAFSLGTKLDKKGAETIIIENRIGLKQTARLEVGPNRVRASIANPSMGNAISKVTDMSLIAPAAWFYYLMTDAGVSATDMTFIVDRMESGIEPDEVEKFELELTNFEAKAMALNGPITGSETSFPVLDKRVKGPQKVICGKFDSFPDSGSSVSEAAETVGRDGVAPYILESDMIREYRDSLLPEQMVRVPEVRATHVYGSNEVYAYEVLKKTENDPGDLAVRVVQITGPAAAGKSEAVEQFAANNGLPFYNIVVNESTRFDQLLDSWVPYLEGGSLPNLSKDEKAVNLAMKQDKEGRDAVEIAIEALGLPSLIDAEFDPDYAWEALGETGDAPVFQEITKKIESKAKEVISSLKEKIEGSDATGLMLAYKCVPSPLVSWARTGGVLEIGEMATMRKGELSKLHDILDFNRKGSIMTAEGECFRHDACYCFLTNNLEYDEDHPLTLPMISRMSLDIEFPQLSESEAVDRLVSNLGCEGKRAKARDIVHAYVTLGKEAMNLSLPGGIDFRNLKQIANRILIHDFDARRVFEKEVVHHFTQHSDPESKVHDEAALISILDELDLFR